MDDVPSIFTVVRVLPKRVFIYCRDSNTLADMPKHKNSLLYIEPSSTVRGCPGCLDIKYKGSHEGSCHFSELFIDEECLGYVVKPIDDSLIDYVRVVIK